MPTQPQWNLYEAAILLQAYVETLHGTMTLQEAIRSVSNHLRQMAVNNGIEIDDVFRNINGITFQMKSMESAYKDFTVMKPASKLFSEIVRIYRNDPERYKILLKEAQNMVEPKSISHESEFFTWLTERVTPSQLSDFYKVFHEISSFCVSRKIIPTPLFMIDNVSQIKLVRNTVEQNSIFRFTHKRDIKKMMTGIKYYLEFCEKKNVATSAEKTNTEAQKLETEADEGVAVEITKTEPFNSEISSEFANHKDALLAWMTQNGMAETSIRSYMSAIKKCGEYANDHGLLYTNIFSLAQAIDVQSLRTRLMADPEFEQLNVQQHNRFSAALAKYEQYFSTPDCRTTDADYEAKYPALYRRLISASKVYIDPNGLSVPRIKETIGYNGNVEDIIDILEHVSWAHKTEDGYYSFSNKPAKKASDTSRSAPVVEVEPDDFDKETFVRVLMMRFQGGLQFDVVDYENFKEIYESLTDDRLEISDADLKKRLRYCGVLYQDRLFPAEGIIDGQTREKLFAYIENSFSAGNKVLYYKSIFSDLSDVFAYCFSLTDEMMLKAYIEFEAEKGKYFFFPEYMSVEKDVKVDHSAEITDYLLAAGKPLSFDDIYAGLSHISSDLIYRETQINPNFLRNEKSHYFHVGIFELSQEEADQIATYISTEIDEDGYAIWSRVFVKIQKEMPVFLENNLYLSSLGIRNALARKLADRFNFDSEVICDSNQHLSMGDVYTLYARHHAPFSDVDLYNFSKEIGTVIYFWAVAEEAVRVSKELFVPKNQIEFDIVATDKALETYLSDDYILAKEVDSFLVFPNVGYEWNAYLLESYLMHYSKKYALINNGTSLNNVAGAVVKRGGAYSEFVDICADVLANSDIELKKDSALDYLAMQNLITRRSYRDIDVAITRARQIRNRKG